jgi:hypothetical protein
MSVAMRPRGPAQVERLRTAVVPLAGLAFAAGVGALLVRPGGLRLVTAALALTVVVIIGVTFPKQLLFGLFIWLAALGLVRRLVSGSAGSGRLDPLLLVGACAILVLVVAAARQGVFRGKSALAKGVGLLVVLFALGALNPYQGGIATGAAGLFVIVVPILSFWVGKAFCDDRTLSGLLKLIAVLALGTGIYGLVQTLSHFPSWDQAWIDKAGYSALNVGGVIRPFGTFSSAQEYGMFLGIGLACWLGFGLRKRWLPVTAAALAALGVATFYQSSRSLLLNVLLALGLAAAARKRLRPAAAGLLGLAFVAALFGVVSAIGPSSPSTSTSSALAAHQIQGLSDPLNPQNSTLLAHLSISGQGLRSALSHPLGVGTGSISMAAGKFGGTGVGTEVDPSNAAVALGIPGLVVFLSVLFLALSKAYRTASARRDALSIVVMCVLVVTLFQWLNGGLYAVAPLPWLALGWLDRPGSGEGQALSTPEAGRREP